RDGPRLAGAYATFDTGSVSRRPPTHAQPGWAMVGDFQRRNLQSPGAQEGTPCRLVRAFRHGTPGRMPVRLGSGAHATPPERTVCVRGARRNGREALPGA